MRGSDGKHCFSEKERDVWKNYMERIMNEKNDLDHNVEGDVVNLISLNEVKTGKSPGPSEVSLELIAASGGVGSQVTA